MLKFITNSELNNAKMIIKEVYVVGFFSIDDSLIFLCNLIAMPFLSHSHYSMKELATDKLKRIKQGQW